MDNSHSGPQIYSDCGNCPGFGCAALHSMIMILNAIILLAAASLILIGLLAIYLWVQPKIAVKQFQRLVTRAFLESEGLELTFWRQTPDDQLNGGQIIMKRAANSRGYRARLK